MEMAINLEHVTIGKTENHLLFKGYVPNFDNFLMYQFDYTGVDLMSTFVLTYDQLEMLKALLREDYGWPPFNEKIARDKLGDSKQYII